MKLYLALGIHNHQPVGNFDFVFEEAYQNSYLPFFEHLERHPHVRLAMHYSGILLEWIRQHHPEYIERLKRRVQSGQIEMMTGGYYEPILSIIPEQDRQGQIQKLSRYIQHVTGDRPEGLWCAERIWEPQLAGALARAGITYTVLDDTHFKCAGFRDEDLQGYFITEELGQSLRLFPISAKLRYTIPFQDPQVTLDYCRQIAENGPDRLLVFADDGEKFGVWPGTYDHVYTHKWLESFFNGLEKNRDWLHLIHFREALKQLPPHGRAYLPTASYMEMMQWTLPSKGFQEYETFENRLKAEGLWDQYSIYVRGGIWRNFLSKYPESNQMHKKMLRVSRKLAESALRGKKRKQAEDHLWAGQCNCPYWHGVFGGLYLPHLRHANFGELIRAEHIIDGAGQPEDRVRAEISDFDADGYNEVLIESNRLNLYFSPIGGRMIELDDRVSAVNFLNLLNRREEGYHRKLHEVREGSDQVASIHDILASKEEGLEKYLTVDPYRRSGWIDHVLGKGSTPENFARGENAEAGNFLNLNYSAHLIRRNTAQILKLTGSGTVTTGHTRRPVQIVKTFTVKPGSSQILVLYEITNHSKNNLPLWFGIEHGFAFHAGDDPKRFYRFNGHVPKNPLLNSLGAEEQIRQVSLSDTYLGVSIRLDCKQPASLWRFPIETVSMSESGFERVYQGSVVMLLWHLVLSPGKTHRLELVEGIENSPKRPVKKS